MKKYIKLIVQGMAIGSLILVFIAIFAIQLGGIVFSELLINNFTIYSIAAMVIGVGFSLPSIIYSYDNFSALSQVLIHLSIGMAVYIITALAVGWIPINYGIGVVIVGIIIALVIAISIWAGFYLYYKKEASVINKQIKKIQNKIKH